MGINLNRRDIDIFNFNNLIRSRRRIKLNSIAQGSDGGGSGGGGEEPDPNQPIADAFSARVLADSGTYEDEECLLERIADFGLIDDASLSWLLIPNAYKEGKIYALRPESGAGDLTFSRASVGYRRFSNIESKAVNVPRISKLNSLCPELLVEVTKTNLILQSEALATTWTTINASISSNAIASPDTNVTADKIQEDTASGLHGVTQDIIKSTAVLGYTHSCFMKSGERTWGAIRVGDTTGSNQVTAWFNLEDGIPGSYNDEGSYTYIDHNIRPIGNGWYWCWVHITTNTAITLRTTILSCSNDFVVSFAGTTNSGIYVWGVKVVLAAVAAIPSLDAYIPTTTGSAARSSDVISDLTGVSSLIGQTQGTLFLHFKAQADNTFKVFSINDGTNQNFVTITLHNTDTIRATCSRLGVSQASLTSPEDFMSNVPYKVAVTYQSNKVALFINGVKASEDLTVTVPACSRIAFQAGGSGSPFYGNVKTAAVLTRALTDAEAIALTTNNNGDLTTFENFINRFPVVNSMYNPIIVNDGVYINTCPAGIIEDPLDSTKALFYRGEFTGATSVDGRVSWFIGNKSNPFSWGSPQGVLIEGSESYDINGARFGYPFQWNGTWYYFYTGIDASYIWRVCVARLSADGRSVDEKLGVILSPSGDEYSVSDGYPVFYEGRVYMIYFTWDGVGVPLGNNNPGRSSLGCRLAVSGVISTEADLLSYTKTGTVLIPTGANGTYDDNNIEGAQLFKLEDKWVILCNVNNGSEWQVFMYYSDTIDSVFKKSRKPYIRSLQAWPNAAIAVPYVYNFGNRNILYWQGGSSEIDIGAAELNLL